MHRSRITITAGLVAALSLWGAGCREEGPAEQTGKAIDDAVENAHEGAEGAAEDVGEAVDEAVDDTKRAVEDATD